MNEPSELATYGDNDMNDQEFESGLRDQEIRRIPEDWRLEILRAARASAAETSSPHSAGNWWRELLWPCPQVWAGLAAVWAIIGALQFLSPGVSQGAGGSSPSLSRELLAAGTERRLLVAELMPPIALTDSPKPPPPGRRSDCRREQVFA